MIDIALKQFNFGGNMPHNIIVNDLNQVECYEEGSKIPHLRQPHWPDGTHWADAAEAQQWADLYAASENDVNAPFAPDSKGKPGLVKHVSPQQIISFNDGVSLLKNSTTLEEKKSAYQAFIKAKKGGN